MARLKNTVWWKCFENEAHAYFGLSFPAVEYQGTGKPFKNDLEQLRALRFNAKKYGLDFSSDIERIERIIARTQDDFLESAREKSGTQAREILDRFEAQGGHLGKYGAKS